MTESKRSLFTVNAHFRHYPAKYVILQDLLTDTGKQRTYGTPKTVLAPVFGAPSRVLIFL